MLEQVGYLIKELWMTFGVAMVPILELRGAIPVGIALGLPPAVACVTAIVGNLVPVPIVILFYRYIIQWLYHIPGLGDAIRKIEKRAHLKGRIVKKYRLFGLILLVAIPLPGTGAWTGALAASLLDIRLRNALPGILIGLIIAGTIITTLTVGVAAII